jgi:hypothetical protein
MKAMRLFIDVHDKKNQTFPPEISREQFEKFFDGYEKACSEEGVVLVRTYVSYQSGQAFCLTMAPNQEAVRRAHERVGLAFDSITEVEAADPHDTFFRRAA